jgi:hypothetical protein
MNFVSKNFLKNFPSHSSNVDDTIEKIVLGDMNFVDFIESLRLFVFPILLKHDF